MSHNHGSLGAMKKKTCYALNNFIVQSDKESGRMPTVYVVTNAMFWFFKFKFNMEKLTCQRERQNHSERKTQMCQLAPVYAYARAPYQSTESIFALPSERFCR